MWLCLILSGLFGEARGEGAAGVYEMVVIQPGRFEMGGPESGLRRYPERARHRVRITQGYRMGKYEVSQALYQQVMGANPSYFSSCGDCPVEQVSWYFAVLFANRLSEMEGLEPCYAVSEEGVSWPGGLRCEGYRLPTEAEWEYAARAGAQDPTASAEELEAIAWYGGNSRNQPHPVGQKAPNAWGLYDMSGNVLEWAWDSYGDYRRHSADPTGPEEGGYRVTRGASWASHEAVTPLTWRSREVPSAAHYDLGFRLARSL